VKTLISKLVWRSYKRFAVCPIEELDWFNSLGPADQREELAKRLLLQIRYFGQREDALPEWREAAKASPAELWKIWPTLPIIDKQTLNRQFAPTEMQRRFKLRGRISATGGSTGEPTRFFLDHAALRASRGLHLYTQSKMGWRPGMPTIVVWGSERDIGKSGKPLMRLTQSLYGTRMIPGFAINREVVATILRIIRKEGPVAMYGFSSLLEYVARETLGCHEMLPPGSVVTAWNGGEMLYDTQVQVFRKAFGVPILNRYGGRELSAIAFQEKDNAPLRILRPWVYVEVVDDAGKPMSVGKPGRLLVTSLNCRGTPFIRYEIGDLAEYAADGFDESGIRHFSQLHGRQAGAIRLANGGIISALYWNHLFKDYSEASEFQIRVGPDGRILILLVGKGFSAERDRQLRNTLDVLWHQRQVDIHWVDSIPRSPQGKLMQVVHER
jgi:phenylacetate-CoA ligase